MTANKIFTIVLVLLLVFIGVVGYYAYMNNAQVNTLNQRLVGFESEQTAGFKAISDNIAALKSSTEASLSALQSQAAIARFDINSVKTDVSAAANNISAVANNISALSKRLDTTDANVAGLSGSIVNTPAVYQKAVNAVVRITDGTIESGSGFIYDSTGRVVTAYHVVNGLSPIYVMLYDGRVSRASLVGYCPFSDVAVLRLDINPSIDPLVMADSGKIQVGQVAVALGSPGNVTEDPLGLRDTFTYGVVSQLNRYETVGNQVIANLIQIDTPINFGNSGGAILDSSGKVIGIADARIDPKEGDGISFIVSSNKVKRVADSIISKGKFPYPWVGVGLSDLTPLQAIQKGLQSYNGALVGSVTLPSPANVAGIQVGDVIVSFDGVAVRNMAEFGSYLGEFKSPGDNVAFEVMRGSAKIKVNVTVGLRPSD